MVRVGVKHLLFLLGCAAVSRAGNPRSSDSDIHRDVVVIGGGSAGTYTAFRLQENGLRVVLLERNNRLGGHVNTFHVPNTDTTFDYGVIVYHNISVALNYFAALGVDIVDFNPARTGAPTFANLNGDAKATTAVPPSIPWANETAIGAATTKYVGLYDTLFSFLSDGFNLPDPVPEDVLLSWADFMAKHGLDAVAFNAFVINQGVWDATSPTALYAMKGFSPLSAEAISGTGPPFISTADSNNQGIYDKALKKLGDGVGAFLNTTITRVTRDKDGVSVIMKTPKSGQRTVRAKQLVIAIPPVVSDLQQIGFDLSADEEHLFGQASYKWYFDAVIQNSGLPDDIQLNNADFMKLDGIPTTHKMVLAMNGIAPGLHTLYYSSDRYISNADAKADIIDTLARFRAANGFNTSVKTGFAAFNNHAPFALTVPVDAIRNGYYNKRNQLQGRQNTWYTGASWQAHDSTLIWNFTESVVIPGVSDVLCSGGRCS